MKNKKRCSVFRLIFIVGILAIFLILLNFVQGAPSSTMSANISFNETPLLNQNADLTVELLSIVNATNTTANITLPPEVELIDGEIQWNVSLIENVTSNHTITIKINATGNFTIETKARDPPSGLSYMGAKKMVYLNITVSNTTVSNTVFLVQFWNYTKLTINSTSNPLNTTFNYTEPNATEFNLSHLRPLINVTFNESQEGQPREGSGTITVTGRFLFENRGGNDVAARFVSAFLYDNDIFSSDDLLGSILTDENGYFSIGPVDNDDPEGGTQDIYVRFIAGSGVGAVQDLSENFYDAFTPTFENVQDGTIDIGTWLQPPSEPQPWWIYDDILSGWLFIANDANPPLENGYVTVEWELTNTDDSSYQPGIFLIYLLAGHANDRDVIVHEYGHHIMYETYSQYFPSDNCAGHSFGLSLSSICAWTEGWATYITLAIDNDHLYSDTTNVIFANFEDGAGAFPSWDEGDEVEGRVTASLWDFSDDSSEDDFNGNFNDDAWKSFERQNDDNFSQYWNAWKNDHTASEENDALITLAQNTIYYATQELDCSNGIDEDNDGFVDCADADCTQGSVSLNGFCCGSGCSTDGGTCQDASTSGFTCTDGNCNTYSEACRNGELESSLVCSGTALSCSGGSCESNFGAPSICDELTPGDNTCDSGSAGELACEVSGGNNCFVEAEFQCNAPLGCDEKDEFVCSDNSGLQCEWNGVDNDDVVEQCETTCGSINECDGGQPGDDFTSCTTGGQTYFADQCSSSCQGEDRGDNICRSSTFAAGCTAVSNCNGLSTGTDLNTCNQVGQTYYEDECSNSCQYQDITSLFECTDTGCSCNEPLCDGLTAGSNIVTCASGQTYFADNCNCGWRR